MPSRTIIVGLDGVPFGMLESFIQTGIMPNTKKFIDNGKFMPMHSSVPEISSVAWSSIITGENPAQHGIFGFMDLRANSYNMRFPNFSELKMPPFWDKSKTTSVIINVPSTYPVRQMNGAHISGFVSIDFDKSVYPDQIKEPLRQMDYRLDVDARKAHDNMEAFLNDVDKTLNARIKASDYLWDKYDWQTFMLVFTGTDRLMHFLYNAYEDSGHQYHQAFVDHFRKIDEAIGTISSSITEDDHMIMLSDHGFQRLDYDVYVNYFLMREGYIKLDPAMEPTLEAITAGTKAFAMDPARIYLNSTDKFPNGSVAESESQKILEDLKELFGSFEIDGRKVIKHIFTKQQVYSGPYMDQAPDMILIGDDGFNLKGAMAARQLFGKGPFTGKHTYHDAFFACSSNVPIGNKENFSVTDAGQTIQSLVCK